jgi:copper chaperone NosL
MTIIDNRFGAELVTKKGKVYKFDAAECMINFFRLGKVNREDIGKYIVTDASKPPEFTDATKAYYLVSEKLPSPMGANVSAYKELSTAENFQKQYGGELMNWEELLKYLKSEP